MSAEKTIFLGTGRRKTSTARVRLSEGTGKLTANGSDFEVYFSHENFAKQAFRPLLTVELRDKIGAAGSWEASSAQRTLTAADQKVNDAVLALMALGFKQPEAHDAIRASQAVLGPQASVEDMVRASLKKGA